MTSAPSWIALGDMVHEDVLCECVAATLRGGGSGRIASPAGEARDRGLDDVLERRLLGWLERAAQLADDGVFTVIGASAEPRPHLVLRGQARPASQLRLPFDAELLARLCLDLARQMERAHALGLCHGALRLASVSIDRDGFGQLEDWAIARYSLLRRAESTAALEHTAAYFSPEQVRKGATASHASDVFALGSLFYHLATGEQAFGGENVIATKLTVEMARPPKRLAELPEPLAELLRQMWQREPTARPSAQEVGHALASLLGRESEERRALAALAVVDADDPEADAFDDLGATEVERWAMAEPTLEDRPPPSLLDEPTIPDPVALQAASDRAASEERAADPEVPTLVLPDPRAGDHARAGARRTEPRSPRAARVRPPPAAPPPPPPRLLLLVALGVAALLTTVAVAVLAAWMSS